MLRLRCSIASGVWINVVPIDGTSSPEKLRYLAEYYMTRQVDSVGDDAVVVTDGGKQHRLAVRDGKWREQ